MCLLPKIGVRYVVINLMVLIILCASIKSPGQNYQFRHYSSDEGFTGAAFKRIVQDSLGFMWILSVSGIFKFDGYTFEKYPLSTSQPNLAAAVGPNGAPWFALDGKVATFDHRKEKLVSFTLPNEKDIVLSFGFAADSSIYFGSLQSGLLCIEAGEDVITARLNELDPEANTIYDIVNENGTLLLGTSHGIWRFAPKTKKFSRPLLDEDHLPVLRSGKIKKIFRQAGYYWVWFDQKLAKITNKGVLLNIFDFEIVRRRIDSKGKFSRTTIVAIAQDKENKFWIATSGLGLFFFDPEKNELVNYRNKKDDFNSPPSDVLHDVILDKDDNVWFSTVPRGIVQIRKPSLAFHNYLVGHSTTGIGIVTRGDSTKLVVATNGSGLFHSPFNDNRISKLKFDAFPITNSPGFENILELHVGKTNLWLGSMTAGVIGLPIAESGNIGHAPSYRFLHNPENPVSLSNNFISAICETASGGLWIGTLDAGLNVARLGNPKNTPGFNILKNDRANSESPAANGIASILPHRDGSVLLGTFTGLDRTIGSSDSFEHLKFEHLSEDMYCSSIMMTKDDKLLISSKDGLFEASKNGNAFSFEKIPLPGRPNVVTVQEDLLGRVWCMSFEGLFFYDKETQFVLKFGKDDGLPSSRTLMAGDSYRSASGMMIFSNAEGVTIFDPLSLKINATKPKPLITRLKINNEIVSSEGVNKSSFVIPESIATIKEVTLDHTHLILELEFSAMDMTAPEKAQYKYMLAGFNESWVQTDWNNRKATYTNLDPGSYTFKVMASNRDGVWGDHITTLEIVVLPAPWNTWWAYSFYVFIILGMLYLALRSILKEERLKASLRIEQIELEKKQMELLKVQEIDKLKSSFFTNISHEFRTPLTLIQGPVQVLLQKFTDDKKVKHQLQLVQNNVQLLLKLINQLLELSRLESRNLTIEKRPNDFDAFLQSIVSYFESQALQKNIVIHLELPKDVLCLSFDSGKLETILINLVGNALKFTPDNGSVMIKACIEGDDHPENWSEHSLYITVADNGIGIPEEKQSLIFDRFYQVNETHNQIGTGIGLALVKELAELMEGTITVKSRPGSGSEFTMKLPVQVLASSNRERAIPDEKKTDLMNGIESIGTQEYDSKVKRILVVEDNHDLRQFIVDSFEGAYHFVEASTGVEGLTKALHEIPELIVSDIMMPEMDGITMSGKIKKDVRTCHIPILFLTAKATDKSKVHALETGAEDYLTKPFNKDELVLKVRNIISSREKVRDKIRIEFLNSPNVVTAQSSDEQLMVKVKEIIHTKMSDPRLGVEIICQEVGFSRTQLYRKITALTGIGINELIRKFRLKKAAQLIQQNWGGVSEVAYEVGFSNLSYFSKCFKDEFGVLPSEYHPK